MVDQLKTVHKKGFVFNNITADDIVFEGIQEMRLINYEYATKEGKEELHPNKHTH